MENKKHKGKGDRVFTVPIAPSYHLSHLLKKTVNYLNFTKRLQCYNGSDKLWQIDTD